MGGGVTAGGTVFSTAVSSSGSPGSFFPCTARPSPPVGPGPDTGAPKSAHQQGDGFRGNMSTWVFESCDSEAPSKPTFPPPPPVMQPLKLCPATKETRQLLIQFGLNPNFKSQLFVFGCVFPLLFGSGSFHFESKQGWMPPPPLLPSPPLPNMEKEKVCRV